MFEEEKITLDRKTFKVLSSDSRVRILKLLNRRRMTLSELSKSMGMSVSTIKEHLDSLCSAELISQIDDGHKWKYYQLTPKGSRVVSPAERKVLIILGISVVAFLLSSGSFLSGMGSGIGSASYSQALLETAPQAAETSRELIVSSSAAFPYMQAALMLFFGILIGFCLYRLFLRRGWKS